MKIKHLYILIIPLFVLILFSCKKKETQTVSNASTEILNAAATGGTVVSTQMQSFMMSAITVAADSGHYFYFPNSDSGKLKSVKALEDNGWIGPNASGWYTRSFTSTGYTYYESLHMGDTIEYIIEISYSGSEGSFDSKTTTTYIKDTIKGKTTYDGYSIWNMQNSGYNEISNWVWRINFIGWGPIILCRNLRLVLGPF